MTRDAVDIILKQWKQERPDLDTSAMGLVGRISRLEQQIARKLKRIFAAHGLEPWEFDVLATLRRSGRPYRLSAGQLLDSMMITSGAVTNRVDRLEKRRLVKRTSNTQDRRGVFVELTSAGIKKIDRALTDHVSNEEEILQGITRTERDTLERLLRKLTNAMSDASETAR